MLEILQFIFSSFYTWLGTVVLISAPFAVLNGEIFSFRLKYKKDD